MLSIHYKLNDENGGQISSSFKIPNFPFYDPQYQSGVAQLFYLYKYLVAINHIYKTLHQKITQIGV